MNIKFVSDSLSENNPAGRSGMSQSEEHNSYSHSPRGEEGNIGGNDEVCAGCPICSLIDIIVFILIGAEKVVIWVIKTIRNLCWELHAMIMTSIIWPLEVRLHLLSPYSCSVRGMIIDTMRKGTDLGDQLYEQDTRLGMQPGNTRRIDTNPFNNQQNGTS